MLWLGVQVAVDVQFLPEIDGDILDDIEREPFVIRAGPRFGS